MYINLTAAGIKAGFALRVVMVDLHALVVDGAATLSAVAVKLLVNTFAYGF